MRRYPPLWLSLLLTIISLTAFLVGPPRPAAAPPAELDTEAFEAADPRVALDGETRQGSLEPGETSSFAVAAEAGELLRVDVEQLGVDLELRVCGPKGEEIFWTDNPYAEREVESALLEFATTGTYVIELEAFASSPPGRFELQLEQRRATAGDRLLVEAFAIYEVGERARQSGDHEKALEAYRWAAWSWRELGEAQSEILAWYRIALLQVSRGEIAAARDTYARAARRARDAGLLRSAAELELGAGTQDIELGEPIRAASSLGRAAELFAEIGDPVNQVLSLNEKGYALDHAGQLDAARRVYQAAAELAQDHGLLEQAAFSLRNLGDVYLDLGHDPLALHRFSEALHLFRRLGNRHGEGITLTDRGTAERRLGRLDAAEATFREAWRRLFAEGDLQMAANSLVGLGLTDLRRARAAGRSRAEHLEAAEKAFLSALTLLRDAGLRRSEANTLINLAEVELLRDDGSAAGERAAAALELFEALADRQGRARGFFTLARVERLDGRLERAWRYQSLALDQLESVRVAAQLDPLRTSYLAFRRTYYEHAVDVAVDLHHRALGRDDAVAAARWLELALGVSERGRARGLLDAVITAGAESPRSADPNLAARERAASDRLVELELGRLGLEEKDAAPALVAAASAEIRQTALELAEVRAARAVDSPSRLDQAQAFNAARFAQRHLDHDTVVLETALGERRGHLFWIDRQGIEIFELPSSKKIENLARLAHQYLGDGSQTASRRHADRVLRRLSREVLGPLAGRLAEQRLVIVAEGPLLYVPFGVLPDPRRLDAADPPPLLERHEVVSLPSVSVLAALRRNGDRPPPRRTLAVMADPVLTFEDPRLHGSAMGEREASGEAGLVPACGHLERLPRSAEEAHALLEMVGEDDSFSALGFEARPELFEHESVTGARILHIATHGRLDTEHPELSGLELSCLDEAGRPRRGTLYAHELYRLSLSAELVVLSACQTALGREVRGEGLLGLTHGFFHAGAPRMVVSLWSVNDRATMELMVRFYRHLLGGEMPPAAALRAAQRELRADPRWADPYYWGGFVVQGDWR